MKTYGIYMDGKKSGSIKTNDIHGYAARVFPQGYEVVGNKLIAGSITLGEAMAFGRKKGAGLIKNPPRMPDSGVGDLNGLNSPSLYHIEGW